MVVMMVAIAAVIWVDIATAQRPQRPDEKQRRDDSFHIEQVLHVSSKLLAPTLKQRPAIEMKSIRATDREIVRPFRKLSNFRDVGGLRIMDGRTVKTGVLFRSD